MNKEDQLKMTENDLLLHSYIKKLEQQIFLLQRRVSLLEQQNRQPGFYFESVSDRKSFPPTPPEFPPKFC